MSETLLFRTPVATTPSAHPIQPHEGCVLLGSCFAQEMGSRMLEHGLRVLCNPAGTLYNPASIALLVHHALQGSTTQLPLLETHHRWHCWWAGTLVEGASQEDITNRMSALLAQLRQALMDASHLFVTLGTNVCYRLQDSGEVVANCHKMPSTLFREETLTLTQCAEVLRGMTRSLLQANPRLRITFTVSPYRYAKYGFHESQLAKSTLLLAVDEVCRQEEAADYFPAYEILLDELRDYRFYAQDMLHPSSVAADYVWQRFCQTQLSTHAQRFVQEYEPIRKGLAHRPSDPSSPEYQTFRNTIEAKERELRRRYGMPDDSLNALTDTTDTQQK